MDTHRLTGRIDRHLLLCAALAFIIAAPVFWYFIWQGGGTFVVRDDFNAQQIPFTVALHDALMDGGLSGFDWNVDLGSSTLLSFAFYELGSVFFWISMLFDAAAFPSVIGHIYILKYVVAALCAYLYLRRMVDDKGYALWGALLYAFSGFQAVNLMFYHFHDAVAFFPLLLLGLEIFMADRDKKGFLFFAFTVFVNCITNYFFFIQEVIFLAIYFLCRFAQKPFAETGKKILMCIVAGALGVGMASILFLPSVLYILQSPRAGVAVGLSELFGSLRDTLFIIRGLFFPGDTMHDNWALIPDNWRSVSCYLPLAGAAPTAAYMVKKRDRLSLLLGICMILSISPLLSSLFTLFTEVYMRWWYMSVLMMALASARAARHFSGKLLAMWAGVIGGITLVFAAVTVFIGPVFDEKAMAVSLALALAGLVCFAFSAKKKKLLIVLTMVFCAATTAFTLGRYRENATDPFVYRSDFDLARGMKGAPLDKQYRSDVNNANLLTMVADNAGMAGFISTRSSGITEFEELFDYFSTNNGIDKDGYPAFSELLGGRYQILFDPRDKEAVFSYEKDGRGIYVYDDGACPIGFAMDRYIYKSDLMNIEVEKRAKALMEAAVVPDGADLLGISRTVPGELNLEADTDDLAEELTKKAVSDFSRNGKGFTCSTDYSEDTWVYFSVPYDTGWDAFVDGERIGIVDSGGMMLLPVKAGNHRIEFKYCTPFFKHGVLLCLFSWICFGVIGVWRKK